MAEETEPDLDGEAESGPQSRKIRLDPEESALTPAISE